MPSYLNRRWIPDTEFKKMEAIWNVWKSTRTHFLLCPLLYTSYFVVKVESRSILQIKFQLVNHAFACQYVNLCSFQKTISISFIEEVYLSTEFTNWKLNICPLLVMHQGYEWKPHCGYFIFPNMFISEEENPGKSLFKSSRNTWVYDTKYTWCKIGYLLSLLRFLAVLPSTPSLGFSYNQVENTKHVECSTHLYCYVLNLVWTSSFYPTLLPVLQAQQDIPTWIPHGSGSQNYLLAQSRRCQNLCRINPKYKDMGHHHFDNWETEFQNYRINKNIDDTIIVMMVMNYFAQLDRRTISRIRQSWLDNQGLIDRIDQHPSISIRSSISWNP